jgi:predicted nucleic acid-binding protein
MMAYLDTSVIYPYYFPETRSAQVATVLQSQHRLTISDYAALEMASAAARNVRDGAITPQDAKAALALFRSHVQSGIYAVLHAGPSHIQYAIGLVSSFQYAIKGPDALHIAIAQAGGFDLVTADGGLATCATALGLNVIHVP